MAEDCRVTGCRSRRKTKDGYNGVITVFFSLTLLIILSLLVTMLESARIGACKSAAKRYVELGTKSLLGAYYLPLYENYHVFGRYCGGLQENSVEELAAEARWLINENAGGKTLLNVQCREFLITEISAMTQENGAFFYQQALQYQKYAQEKELVEWLLAMEERDKQANRAGLVLQKSMETAEKSSEAERTLMRLLECVDGFRTDGENLKQSLFGKIEMLPSFAKRVVPYGLGEGVLVPGNPILYQAQSWYYCKPDRILREMKLRVMDYDNAEERLTRIMLEKKKTVDQLSEEYQKKTEEERECRKHIEAVRTEYETYLASLSEAIKETQNKSAIGITLLHDLEKDKMRAAEAERNFLAELEQKRSELPESIYQETRTQHERILQQVSIDNEIGFLKDMRAMEIALANNEKLLEEAAGVLYRAQEEGMPEQEAFEAMEMQLFRIFSGMKFEGLQFAYEEIKLPTEGDSFSSLISSLEDMGILFMVVDKTDTLSKGYMTTEELPSALCDSGEENSILAVGDIVREALFLQYLDEHFANYTSEYDRQEVRENEESLEGIVYQLEYILYRQRTDIENLSQAAGDICMTRFAANLLTLYASAECREKMKGAAMAIVGFTGIGALVLLTELIIGMLWAAECAIVETAVLFQGGNVSVLTTNQERAVAFEELLRFSKTFVNERAKQRLKNQKSDFSMTYRDYLILFLLTKSTEWKIFGAMDVIQQMLRIGYEDEFRMKYCVCGVEVNAAMLIPYRFLPVLGLAENEGVLESVTFGIAY